MAGPRHRSIAMRGTLVAASCLLALAFAAGPASAGNQKNGGHYSGYFAPTPDGIKPKISFNVSPNGSHVVNMKVEFAPSFCGYGGPQQQKKAQPAAISSTGHFHETLTWLYGSQVVAKLKVTGQFHTNEKESGKGTVTWTGGSECNGTRKYSTKAQ